MRFTAEYIDSLLASHEASIGVDLHAIITSSAQFDRAQPCHGLSEALFAYVEVTHWEAASSRSGVWTYYEVTPDAVQQKALKIIQRIAPRDIADAYAQGMLNWQSEDRIGVLDDWLSKNETSIREWLRVLANENRSDILQIA